MSTIKVRRGVNASLPAGGTVAGEPRFSTDTGQLYIDDGTNNVEITPNATNVTSAGALMDSELTDIASVKALNQGVATTDSPTFAAITAATATVNTLLDLSGTSGTANILKLSTKTVEGIASGFNKAVGAEYFMLAGDVTGRSIFGGGVDADTYRRIIITAEGEHLWGPGSASRDTYLRRVGAGQLEVQATSSGAELNVLHVRNGATASGTGAVIQFTSSTAIGSSSGGSQIASVRNASAGSSLIFRTAASGSYSNVLTLGSDKSVTLIGTLAGRDQTLTVANTDNKVGLTVTQNDTTNNPNGVTVTNAGTGNGVYIDQNGNGMSLFIQSSSSTAENVRIEGQSTTASNFECYSAGVHTGTAYNAAHRFALTSGSSTGTNVEFRNEGTGANLVLDQNGNGKSLDIDSEATSATVFNLDGQNTSGNMVLIKNNGIHLGTTFATTYIVQEHGSSTAMGLAVRNDGTGNGVYIEQNGVSDSGQYALKIYSNSAQTTEEMVNIKQDNASSTKHLLEMENDGSGHIFRGVQNGVLAAGARAFEARSSVAQTQATAAMMFFALDNASSTSPVSYLLNAGTGDTLFIDHNNSGKAINIDMDANSASSATGLHVNVANAGAGGAYAAIFEAGNVGIGTTAPSEKLHVSGNIAVTGANGTLTLSAATDGGEFNIGASATGTLALYGSGGNTLHVNLLDGNLTVAAGSLIKATSSPPASAGATGTTGQIEWDSSYIYICIASNTWQRVAHATW